MHARARRLYYVYTYYISALCGIAGHEYVLFMYMYVTYMLWVHILLYAHAFVHMSIIFVAATKDAKNSVLNTREPKSRVDILLFYMGWPCNVCNMRILVCTFDKYTEIEIERPTHFADDGDLNVIYVHVLSMLEHAVVDGNKHSVCMLINYTRNEELYSRKCARTML